MLSALRGMHLDQLHRFAEVHLLVSALHLEEAVPRAGGHTTVTGEAPLSALMPGTQYLAHSGGQMKTGQGTQNSAPTSFPKAQHSWVHSCFSCSQGFKTEEQRIQPSLHSAALLER